jgi:acetate---CoA ligase (ADP-forming)
MKKLFKPKSVVLVGASDRPGSFGFFAAKNLIDTGDKIKKYFVNPKKEEVLGIKTYKSLEELPEIPELILLGIPAKATNPILRQAGEMGIKAAIVFSSGFAEDHLFGGVELEKEMVKIANEYNMKILGPNCLGIINNVDKVKLWSTGADPDFSTRKKGAAVIAQSGGYTIGSVDRHHIDLSYAISTGNGNIVTIEELMEFCVDDDDVTVVALYLEGIKKPDVFYRALVKAAKKRKPVIILKSGSSKKGAISAASHTGNIAGSHEIFKAIFDKYGVISVSTAEEFFCAIQTYTILGKKLPKDNKFAVITLSGGEATISADMAERFSIELPELTEETKGKLNNILPDFAIAKNPMDMTTDLLGDPERLGKLFEIIGDDENIEAIIAGLGFEDIGKVEGYDYDMHAFLAKPLLDYQEKPNSVPILVVPQYEGKRSEKWRMKLKDSNIPIMSLGEIGYSIIGNLAKNLSYDVDVRLLESAVPKGDSTGEPISMSEYDSKLELIKQGIGVPKQTVAHSIEELTKVCSDLGFPLVLKVNSKDILHKTDAGGVKLGINSEEDAINAYESILKNCKEYQTNAQIDGILVQQMVKKGTEIIIGIKNDEMFGPMLLVGMGGVFVEIFKDVALTPCPINKEEAIMQLKSLKAFPLLEGYRGSNPADVDALAELMVKVSEYAVKNKDTLVEMDINPVFVYEEGEGLAVVDALIIKK